ncbi:MAG TPA: type III secretion inner membrane ring lipoprotein SctJ [Bordetella sp.]|nr:type III secretion inner membrane ring lipoprotein SctJ [Bordetella sp.]
MAPCRVSHALHTVRQTAFRRFIHLIIVVGVLLLAGCSNRVELFSSTTDAEANEILAALLQSAIPAEKQIKKSGVTISVAEPDVAKALGVLRQQGLPRARFEGMGKIFQKEGMISSPLEERARYIYALSQELESTLSKMDGVLVARVHVVLPDQDAARIAKTPASAAVFIKHQAGYNLDVLKPQIRTLVTHAIPELGEDRVSVVLIVAQRPTSAASALPLSAQASAGDRADTSRGTRLWWAIGAVAVACALGAAAIWARSRRRNVMMHDGLLDKGPGLDGFGQG